jgi:hypothetical protein
MSLSGSCLCGEIHYTISTDVTELRACHCIDCQKTSGAAGSVNAMIKAADFRITQGAPKKREVKAASGRTLYRYFCGDCGSPIYSQRQSTPENVAVRAGTLDDAPPMKITGNIWTRTARPWAYIDPASVQAPGQPDAPATAR